MEWRIELTRMRMLRLAVRKICHQTTAQPHVATQSAVVIVARLVVGTMRQLAGARAETGNLRMRSVGRAEMAKAMAALVVAALHRTALWRSIVPLRKIVSLAVILTAMPRTSLWAAPLPKHA
jgi:hypothetical protein